MTAPGCTFCAIVSGELPAATVLHDDTATAFLDSKPVFKGHVLVVPRAHVATLADLPAADIGAFFATVQAIARAVESSLDADGTFVAMNNKISQSVPHLHVHVIPRRRKDGLRGFFWPRLRYDSDAERDDFAARVRGALGR
jgi:histidine triad (HIT) family protein